MIIVLYANHLKRIFAIHRIWVSSLHWGESVKCFEQSQGLDVVLCKNVPLPFALLKH